MIKRHECSSDNTNSTENKYKVLENLLYMCVIPIHMVCTSLCPNQGPVKAKRQIVLKVFLMNERETRNEIYLRMTLNI